MSGSCNHRQFSEYLQKTKYPDYSKILLTTSCRLNVHFRFDVDCMIDNIDYVNEIGISSREP